MAKLKYRCLICNKKVSIFSNHSRKIHGMSSKEYYDKYVKKNGEDLCPICGNKNKFLSLIRGYSKHCSLKCSNSDINVKHKKEKSCLKSLNVTNPSFSKEIIDKKRKNADKKGGYSLYFKNLFKISQKIKEKRYHDKNYNNREKARKTLINKTGFDNTSKDPKIKKKKEQTTLKHFKVKHPSQSPEIHAKVFANRKRPKSEIYFEKLLRKNKIEFKIEYYVKKEDVWQHHFDFAIFKNKKLKCLVEIDGEYYHGLYSDCDGFCNSSGLKDYLRWKLVPNKVKFLVIDSSRLDEGFKELLRILPIKYKDWKKEMLRSIPKNIEDAIPKFDKKRMLRDWKHLIKYDYNPKANIGKSILLTYCRSRWDNFEDWESIRKTLYKSPVSSHHLLEGLDNFKNVSKLREKFRKKYKGIKEVVVKHHSPEKMLAICSLGKMYISKEPLDKESIKIIEFLKLNAFQSSNKE